MSSEQAGHVWKLLIAHRSLIISWDFALLSPWPAAAAGLSICNHAGIRPAPYGRPLLRCRPFQSPHDTEDRIAHLWPKSVSLPAWSRHQPVAFESVPRLSGILTSREKSAARD